MSLKPIAAVAALFALTSVPALALPLPNQVLSGGDDTIVQGTAHVYDGALGTYIYVDRPESATTVAGFIPFGDQNQYPDLDEVDGRQVQIHGVVAMDGLPLITMTAPDQLAVIG